MYSLGITPYPGVLHKDLLHYLKSGDRMENPDSCPQYIYNLMLKCWEFIPDERPSFEEVLVDLHTMKFQEWVPAVS